MNELQLTRLDALQFFNNPSTLAASMQPLEQFSRKFTQFEENLNGLYYLIGKKYDQPDFTDLVSALGNQGFHISQEIEISFPLLGKACQVINAHIAHMEKITVDLSAAPDLTEEEKLYLSALHKKIPYIKAIRENAEAQLTLLENLQEDLNTLQGILESNNDLEEHNIRKKLTKNFLLKHLKEDCGQPSSKAREILEEKNSIRLIGILSAISLQSQYGKEIASEITCGYLSKITEMHPIKKMSYHLTLR